MSLLDHYKEKFCFMEETNEKDGAGGSHTIWTEGMDFDVIQRHDTTIEARIAEKAKTASTYTFFVNKGLSIRFGAYVKRMKDGQVFRITQDSMEDYTPESSPLNLMAISAEKAVLPK